jgi:hypothetical protein
MPPRETFELEYKQASGEGAIYELRMRLLADKIPALQATAYAARLEDVEGLICNHFTSALSQQEKDQLKTCRQLRNKILHCDFTAARDKLRALGQPTQSGGVRKIDIAGLTGNQMAQKILAATSGDPNSSVAVATAAQQAGTVFAWLLEVGQAGDLASAAASFAKAAAIIDRLARL